MKQGTDCQKEIQRVFTKNVPVRITCSHSESSSPGTFWQGLAPRPAARIWPVTRTQHFEDHNRVPIHDAFFLISGKKTFQYSFLLAPEYSQNIYHIGGLAASHAGIATGCPVMLGSNTTAERRFPDFRPSVPCFTRVARRFRWLLAPHVGQDRAEKRPPSENCQNALWCITAAQPARRHFQAQKKNYLTYFLKHRLYIVSMLAPQFIVETNC